MDRKKEIIKCIESISGRYSAYEVFADWIKLNMCQKCLDMKALKLRRSISIYQKKP